MVEIKSGKIIASINETGAQLSRLYDGGTDTEYLWGGNPEIWAKHAPVLWPFVGRLKDGVYEYNKKKYEMTIHGIAPYSEFKVVDSSSSYAVFQLVSNEETKKVYPFDFIFSVKYSIIGNSLVEEAAVENTGKEKMYYGFGGHPGFNVPLEKGLEFTDYRIEFPECGTVKRRIFAPSCLETGYDGETDTVIGGAMELTHDLFDDDAVVLSGTGGRAVLKSDKGERALEVDYSGALWCGIWHSPKKEVPFVCIEPWWSLPGRDGVLTDISKKKDLLSLKSGETREHRIVIKMM